MQNVKTCLKRNVYDKLVKFGNWITQIKVWPWIIAVLLVSAFAKDYGWITAPLRYEVFFVLRTAFGLILVVLAYDHVTSEKLKQKRLTQAIAFWALFPPAWFFTEYYALDCGLIAGREAQEYSKYADFAAKIWAAVLAVMIFKKKSEDDKQTLEEVENPVDKSSA